MKFGCTMASAAKGNEIRPTRALTFRCDIDYLKRFDSLTRINERIGFRWAVVESGQLGIIDACGIGRRNCSRHVAPNNV